MQPTVQAATLPWVAAFVWSALISGGHIGRPEGTGNGQHANCVGTLREPYAVC